MLTKVYINGIFEGVSAVQATPPRNGIKLNSDVWRVSSQKGFNFTKTLKISKSIHETIPMGLKSTEVKTMTGRHPSQILVSTLTNLVYLRRRP